MLKQLLSSVREYKKSSLLAPLFVSCEVILEVLIPLLIAKLIDEGVELGDGTVVERRTDGDDVLCKDEVAAALQLFCHHARRKGRPGAVFNERDGALLEVAFL